MHTSAALFLSFGLVFGVAVGAAAKDQREAVIVSGFDGELTNQHPPNEMRYLPPAAEPLYFYPRNDLEKGRKHLPPDGLVHAVAVYLSKNGYWIARKGIDPTVLLVLHWFSVQDDITHFGKPSQLVDLNGPGGRGLLTEDGEVQNPPFVLISAFDLKALEEKPPRIVKLWQMALWLRVVQPKGEVEFGLPEVKQYLDPVPAPPSAPAKP